MLIFPNCKINLGLHITGKRSDGFHDLQTIFYPLPLKDGLEVVTAAATSFRASGLPVPGDTADNLVLKAYHLLRKDFPAIPAVQIYLHKHIPMGAGLGGGSADAAFMLQLLNRKYQLQLEEPALLQYAALLGSDCPFFIRNRPVYATGRGEVMENIDLQLDDYAFLLVYPGIHVNTSWAFSQIKPQVPSRALKEAIRQPVKDWKYSISNDFEAPVLKAYPELNDIKARLYAQGAQYAAMSGSGSAMVGIFEKQALPALQWHSQYRVFKLEQ